MNIIWRLIPWCLVIVLLSLYGYKSHQYTNRDAIYQLKVDSLREHFREQIKEDGILFEHYAKAQQDLKKEKLNAYLWKRRYERLLVVK